MLSQSFVRGGNVHPWNGSSRAVGNGSYYWATTAYPNASYAYNQAFGSANVLPSNTNNRALGFSVRARTRSKSRLHTPQKRAPPQLFSINQQLFLPLSVRPRFSIHAHHISFFDKRWHFNHHASFQSRVFLHWRSRVTLHRILRVSHLQPDIFR